MSAWHDDDDDKDVTRRLNGYSNNTMTTTTSERRLSFTHTSIYKAIRRGDVVGLLLAIADDGDGGWGGFERTSAASEVPENDDGETSSRRRPPPRRRRRRRAVELCDDERTLFAYIHLVVVAATPATERSHVPMIYQLANAGVDVDAVDCRRRTALELAVVKHFVELMVALLRVGADQSKSDYRRMIADRATTAAVPVDGDVQAADDAKSSGTARRRRDRMLDAFDRYAPGLWTAAVGGDVSQVHILVNSWCRINVRRDGVTLLEHIQRRRHEENGDGGFSSRGLQRQRRSLAATTTMAEIARLLEDYELTIEFVHATLAGDERRMLELLMNSRPVDVNIMDISHHDDGASALTPRSLREAAIFYRLHNVLHLLPEPPTAAASPVISVRIGDDVKSIKYNILAVL